MKYYIYDTTLREKRHVFFDTLGSLIIYLNEVCIREFGHGRKQKMIELESLGHGYDDSEGATFTRFMSDIFEIGVIKNNTYVRCDVHMIDRYNKPEFGD